MCLVFSFIAYSFSRSFRTIVMIIKCGEDTQGLAYIDDTLRSGRSGRFSVFAFGWTLSDESADASR